MNAGSSWLLRSIKIGKLRRISRAWITEFVERLEAAGGRTW
jgi:hypothetical protein